jgi:hypothetical protein
MAYQSGITSATTITSTAREPVYIYDIGISCTSSVKPTLGTYVILRTIANTNVAAIAVGDMTSWSYRHVSWAGDRGLIIQHGGLEVVPAARTAVDIHYND